MKCMRCGKQVMKHHIIPYGAYLELCPKCHWEESRKEWIKVWNQKLKKSRNC